MITIKKKKKLKLYMKKKKSLEFLSSFNFVQLS